MLSLLLYHRLAMCDCLEALKMWCLPEDGPDNADGMTENNEIREILADRLEQRVGDNTRRLSNVEPQCAPVAINFVADDLEAVRLCSRAFEAANIAVWPSTKELDALGEDGDVDSAASQALLSCRVYIALLSKASVSDELFSDRTSLAYVDNKVIEPVGLASPSELKKNMGPALKLVVLAINWLRVRDDTQLEDLFRDLVAKVAEVLQSLEEEEAEEKAETAVEEEEENPHRVASLRARVADIQPYLPGFWDRRFPDQPLVSAEEFVDGVRDTYGANITEDFGDEWEQSIFEMLRTDIIGKSDSISREEYDEFLGVEDGGNRFYMHFKDYCTGTLALRNILSMKSTVRLTVIRNMGKFSTYQVVKLLRKMLEDPDPNVRAVAALALGKCRGKHVEKVTKSLLDLLYCPLSYDRLVRESVVLALGQLRVREAFPILSNLWRNDPIKDVREAADIALEKIGGENVERLRKINQKLNEEVQYLHPA